MNRYPEHEHEYEVDYSQVLCIHCGATQPTAPHSRACGIRRHDHGPECHTNCPSCNGRDLIPLPSAPTHAPHIDHPTPHRPGYKYDTVVPLVEPEPQLEEAHAVAMSVQATITAAERTHAEWPSATTDAAWYVRRNQ